MLHRLVAEADVFITNFPPAVRGRLGMTYAELAPLNERLIYASFTGYGEKGDEANKPGFDSNAYWARSGLMDLVRADTSSHAGALGRRHGRPSLRDGAVWRDRHRALQARAHRQGLACQFEPDGQRRLGQRGAGTGQIMRREIRRAASARTRAERGDQSLQCRDGRWLILSLLNEERQWPTLARCLGREDFITDARFATKPDRHARSLELIKIFDEIFATQGPRRMAQDTRRQRPGVRRGRHPRRHSQRHGR